MFRHTGSILITPSWNAHTYKAVPYGRRVSGVPQHASGRNGVLCNCVAFCALPTTDITAREKLLLAHLTGIKLSPRCFFFRTFLSVSWHGGIMPLEYPTNFSFPTLVFTIHSSHFIPSFDAT